MTTAHRPRAAVDGCRRQRVSRASHAAVTIPLGLALLADDKWLPRRGRRVAAPEWPAGEAQGIS